MTFGHLPEVSNFSVVRVSLFPTCHGNDEDVLRYSLNCVLSSYRAVLCI